VRARTRSFGVVAALAVVGTASAQVPIGQAPVKSELPPPRVTAMTSAPPIMAIGWDDVVAISEVNATTQIGAAGPGPLHDKVYRQLRQFSPEYPRWQLWGGGSKDPNLGNAEVLPPANGVSHWDFSRIDPDFIAFANTVRGHQFLVDLEVTPDWMYKPNAAIAESTLGPLARVHTKRELAVTPQVFADYYARVVSWWEKGGFTDEYGKWHPSGHHFKIPYWEVLNERNMAGESPEEYTRLYDATVLAIRQVDPDMQFVGLAIAHAWEYPQYITYFLNPKNHAPGVPLSAISLHCYAKYGPDDPPAVQVATTFDQAERFIDTIQYVNSIRDLLSPATRIMVDELGTIIGTEAPQVPWPKNRRGDVPFHIRLNAAMYGYLYGNMARLGVVSAGQSSFGAGSSSGGRVGAYVADPMLTSAGDPNPRYKVAKLLMTEFPPGSRVVASYTGVGIWRNPFPIYVEPYVTQDGTRKVLIVNERDVPYAAVIPDAKGGKIHYVAADTGSAPYKERLANANLVTVSGLEVAILTLPNQH
jgi:Glycosyl hydrolases family 39